jgi:hypothetical protein
VKANPAVLVLVLDRRQRPVDGNDDPEFLGNLAAQAFREGFTRFDLATGQFPVATQYDTLQAAANEQTRPPPRTVVDE